MFDVTLQRAAIAAGAEFFVGRADEAIADDDGRLAGFALSSTSPSSKSRVRAEVIVGADGATSHVADVAGLSDRGPRTLGLRSSRLRRGARRGPAHHVLDAGSRRSLSGVRVGVPRRRRTSECWSRSRCARRSDRGTARGARLGRVSRRTLHASVFSTARALTRSRERPLGAWLKMGLVGTTPVQRSRLSGRRRRRLGKSATGRRHRAGDGQRSGRSGSDPRRHGPSADRYRAHLSRTHAPYLSTTASVQRTLLRNPRLVAALTRGLTAPGVGRTLAGGWSIAWNNLVDGAAPSVATGVAATAAGLGHMLTVAKRRPKVDHTTAPIFDAIATRRGPPGWKSRGNRPHSALRVRKCLSQPDADARRSSNEA